MVVICFRPSVLSFLVGRVEDMGARGFSSFGMRWLGCRDNVLELVGHAEKPEQALAKIRLLIEQAQRAGKPWPPVVDVRLALVVDETPASERGRDGTA
jgi:hypothetical protein